MGLFTFKKKVILESPTEHAEMESELPEIRLPQLDLPSMDEPTLAPQVEVEDGTSPVMPVFVSVEDYQAVLEHVNKMKELLADAEGHMKTLQGIKTHQEKELESWRRQLEDAEKKLSYVDELLFQAE